MSLLFASGIRRSTRWPSSSSRGARECGCGRARVAADWPTGSCCSARSRDHTLLIAALASRAAGVVVGDLSSAVDVRSIADQVNAVGRMDAVIHNAGVYTQRSRGSTQEGHASTFAINTLAPYMLTALIERPARLVYLSKRAAPRWRGIAAGHRLDEAVVGRGKAYAETKLARRRACLCPGSAVAEGDEQRRRSRLGAHEDGRRGAPVDLKTGLRTQAWLAREQRARRYGQR